MFGMIAQIRKLFMPKDKKRLLGVSLLMALSALGEMLGLGLLIGMIALFLSPDLLEKYPIVKELYQISSLSWNAFVICWISVAGVALALKNIFALFVVYVQSKFIFDKNKELVCRLFSTYLQTSYRFSLDNTLAERAGYVGRARQISQGILLPLMQILADGIVILVLCIAMFSVIPLAAVLCFAVMFCFGVGVYWLTRSANVKVGKRYHEAMISLGIAEHTGFAGVKIVKAMCREKFFIRKFKDEEKNVARASVHLYTLGQIPRLALESVALVLLLVLFIILLQQGKSPDEILLLFSVIIAAMARILPALSRCNYNMTIIRQNRYLFDFVTGDIFSLEPEKLGNVKEKLTFEKSMEIKNLNFTYDGKKQVLKNFSLCLEANKCLGISGKTGSGKTTLADLLLGLLRPDSGEILVDGKSIFDNLQGWRQMIGYVSQDVYIASASVRENVAFGIPADKIDDKLVWQALEMAQISDWAESVPGRLDYLLQDSGTNLSGGQRQRIGIARALYNNPKLLVLDEATSALDNETEAAFVEALENLNGKLTMVVIAHRLSTLEKCDQRVTISAEV